VKRDAEHDTFHEEIAVASIDLLGVSSLLKEDSNATIAMNACEGLVGQVVVGQHAYEHRVGDSLHIELFDRGMYFGDSIYLFADPTDPLDQQVEKLLPLVATVIWVGLFSQIRQEKKRFLARAGIAVGNLRIRTIPATPTGNVFPMGTAMSNAHQIESSQAWIGGALHSDLPSHHARPYRLPYEVSMSHIWQEEHTNQNLDAINWLKVASDDERYDETYLLRDLNTIASQQNDARALEKWMNTASFVEANLEGA